MNPKIKAKWVEALRSGKYQQTDGFLNACGGMCCLGVLCDILHPEKWNQDEEGDTFSFEGESTLPPNTICIEAGLPLPIRSPFYNLDTDNTHVVNKLATMNDNGVTFTKIADFIEENL